MSDTACECSLLNLLCLLAAAGIVQVTTTSCEICPPTQSPLLPPWCGDGGDDDCGCDCGCG